MSDPTCTIGEAIMERLFDTVIVSPDEAICSGPLSPLLAPGVSEAMIRERFPRGAWRYHDDVPWQPFGIESGPVPGAKRLSLDGPGDSIMGRVRVGDLTICEGHRKALEPTRKPCPNCDEGRDSADCFCGFPDEDWSEPPALDLTALLREPCAECENADEAYSCTRCMNTGTIPNPSLTQALDNARELGLIP